MFYKSPSVTATHDGFLVRLTTDTGPASWDPDPELGYGFASWGWGAGEAIVWDAGSATISPGAQIEGAFSCSQSATDVPFSVAFFDWPEPPVSYTVNTAAFRPGWSDDTASVLGFLVPGTAEYVADLTRLTDGAARFDGTVVASTRQVSLGTLSTGRATLEVGRVEGPTSKWTVAIRALPVIVSDLAFSSPYVRPGTNVRFEYRTSGDTRITATVRDALARPVATLASNFDVGPGEHTLTWDATNDAGVALRSGVYTLLLDHTDPSGASGSDEVPIVIDSERPTVDLVSTSPLRRRNALVLEVKDRLSPLRTARLRINGSAIDSLATGGSRLAGRPDAGWKSGHTYRWAVTAADAAGNETDARGRIRVRGPLLRRCRRVAITPRSGNALFNIRTENLRCRTARAALRRWGRNGYRPREPRGFNCRITRRYRAGNGRWRCVRRREGRRQVMKFDTGL